MSEGSDKVVHVYPTNPALQRFDKKKIVQTKFFQDILMNQSILEKIFNKKVLRYLPSQLAIDADGMMKRQSHQLNHEIDLCKKELQQHLEKKGKADLIFKSLLSLSVEDERIVV